MEESGFIRRPSSSDLSPDPSGDLSAASARNLRDARQDFEKDFILKSLKDNDWNISRTAQVLGIERSHLHRKIKSFGIETKE
jgi:two-component system nitrogen regulation response regulator NtrX